ncbi:ATP synthase F1 subunit epsilon [bacterium]|nr:ATP synthase F1 subunit epsilon [bacterium]
MADEKTFPLEVLTLQKRALREDVRFVIAPGQEGVFEVLADHMPYVFALKPGPLQIRQPGGGNTYLAVGGGFLIVQREQTTVLTRSADRPEEIDRERAARARARAEARLRDHEAGLDVPRAQAALQRALARLRVAEYAESR